MPYVLETLHSLCIAFFCASFRRFRRPCPCQEALVLRVSWCGTSPATRRVRARLLSLPFPAFALTVSHLLRRLGYEGVTLRGVTGSKGRNSYGGLDIEATLLRGLTRSRVICQLRQYDTESVPRQSVDVLRGAMLRMGADQGLLVTTSGFSPAAVEAAQAAQHVAPVRLIDGNELAMLLLQHNLLSDRSETGTAQPPAAREPAKSAEVAGVAGAVGERQATRAVPTATPAPARSDTPGSMQEGAAQGGEQPPIATATAVAPLPPFPKAGRRGIAITIVLSPLSGSGNKSGSNEGRS